MKRRFGLCAKIVPSIDRLVDLLVERETIGGEELRQIVAEYTVVP